MRLTLPLLFLIAVVSHADAWQMKQAPLMTQWAAQVDTNAPLPEYPRPQLVRSDWVNLNGLWEFQAGAVSDLLPAGQTLTDQILVPFPMESAISGVMQYHAWSWYRRTFSVPAAWSGKRIILHFDAVDWQSRVFVNEMTVGTHLGGYDPFSYDITPFLNATGPQELIVQVYNPVDNGGQPRGKQTLYPGGIMYTSSTGIWQPVWLEPVDSFGVQDLVIIPDLDQSRLRLTVNTYATNGVTVSVAVTDSGTVLSTTTGAPQTELDIPIDNTKLWSPDSPFLYGLQIQVTHNGATNDTVSSYFGMRKISVEVVNGVRRILLNNQFCFQMGPLDQGFWPDGLYTAPTDDAQKFDLEQEKALGFNMVRKHIKVERQRWYYWADKLGLLVWQDMPSCNSYTGNPNPPAVDPVQFQTELTRMVQTHWNSPSIIMWDTFNESQGQQDTSDGVGQASTASIVQLVKTLDPWRLVNEASGGNYYDVGDVFDSHNYPAPGNPSSADEAAVDGEYGGIGFQFPGHLWNPALAGGNYIGATTPDDIASIYSSFTDQLVDYKSNGSLNAAVYTQITDVENECNGLFTYDRVLKLDPAKILLANQKAITGKLSLTEIVPTSQNSGQTWRYTTSTPSANWSSTNFNDSAWASGQAGFGTAGTPGAVVRTTWNTSDIWIRRQFQLGSLSAADISGLVFNCFHDEDCEIYINGVLAGSAASYSTSYVLVDMTAAGKSAILPNKANLIAVHCHQTTGGQNIDVGISKKIETVDALIVPTDPLGYWKLDETVGTTAADSSGSGNNGTVNSATWNSQGKVNGCLTFDGARSYVQAARSISNDFSIAFWVATTQPGGTGSWRTGNGLVTSAASGNDFGTVLLGDKFGFGGGSPDTTALSTTSINDGAWHHCVATREQATGVMKVYVDGALEASVTGNTNSLNSAAYLRFGSIQSGGYFAGCLDEIQVWNRVLGHNEIAALYGSNASTPPPPSNLTTVAGQGQVTLTWWQSLGATLYAVNRSTNAAGPYVTIGTTSGTTFIDTNAMNGVTYYYTVSALNAVGTGAASEQSAARPYLLATWFRADAINGLGNGAVVATWTDLSGNGNDATQASVSQQPLYAIGSMNGLPAVRFDATKSTFLAFKRPVQDDFTILCVFRSTQGSGTGNLYFQGAGLVSGEVSGTTTDFGTCLFADGHICAGTGQPDVGVNSTTGFNDGTPHLMTFKRTKSTGETALWVDGISMGTVQGNTSALGAMSQLVLGAQQTLVNYFSGDIAEVKIFSAALSDADRMGEESILKCKYSIAGGGVAPAAPTGLTAAADSLQIIVKWNSVAGASTYQVRRSTNGLSYQLLADNLSETAFDDLSGTPGVDYYYEVSASSPCGVSGNSAPVAAQLLPRPTLAVSLSSGSVVLSWPASAANWSLWATTNLVSPTTWGQVSNSVISVGAQVNVVLPLTNSETFFRLQNP